MSGKILLLKNGNRLVVNPTNERIYDILTPVLTFEEQEFLRGWELREAINHDQPRVRFTSWECFGLDHKKRLVTAFGFWRKIYDALKANGYKVRMKDTDPHPDPSVYQPEYERLKMFGVKLKQDQPEFLDALFSNPCGRFSCPPGFGKSFMISVVGLLCPRARIDVVSKNVAVIRDRIYPELCQMLPDVGIVGGGKRRKGRRVMCYTIDSAHHADGTADIMFGDECHQFGADRAAYRSGRTWGRSRNFGLSASHDMRLDGKDLRVEGIFGPIIHEVPYQQSQEAGVVAPIRVLWTSCSMDWDPCEGEIDSTEKKRHGIWQNDYRNDLIATDARLYDKDTQVLIPCETIRHAVHLKARLPEFQMVYREDGMKPRDRKRYILDNLISRNEPSMTSDRRSQLTSAFEQGRLKKAIVTTVWNVGVDFRQLGVLLRADGGGSPINNTQIPGRLSRTFDGKEVGILHDYMDEFNRGFRTKARRREKDYDGHGWEQQFPDKARKGSVRDQLDLFDR